jgi:ABC-2 type transport system permease protein
MITEAKTKVVHVDAGLSTSLRISLAIAAKDILDAVRNKTILSIMLGTFILMLGGVAMPLIIGLTDLPPMAAFYDPAGSELVKPLTKSREFRFIRSASLEEMEISIAESERMPLGLVIPSDFDEKAAAGEPIQIEGYLLHSVSSAKGIELMEFFEDQLRQAAGGTPVVIQPVHTAYFPLEASGQPAMATTTFIIALLVMGAFLTPFLMTEEKEKHTLEALLISPASYTQVASGKALAGLTYCLAAAVVLLAFNFNLVNFWGIMLVAILAGSLFSIAVGLLVGMFFDNQTSMNLVLGAFMLILLVPTFIGSFASTNLPPLLNTIIPYLPTSALAVLLRTSFAGSVPLDVFLPNLGLLMAYALVLLGVVVWRLRRYEA